MANCYKNNCRYLICAEQGEATLDQAWQESSSIYSRIRFSGAEGFCFAWKEIETEWDGRWKTYRFEESRTVMAQSLQAFQSGLPVCPSKYAEAAAQAGYLLWSSMVRSDGFLSREAMLMSKNWMTSVWSWDHCFNAIALSHGEPALAWEQFMLLFDFQDPTGLLPDSVNDVHVVWNYCKPPIHGYSIVETAKANDLDVLKYIEYILRRLPIAEGNFTDEFLEKLAPWNPDVKNICGRSHI
ncbi:MAG: transposase domain-containing protein [Clostridia bacterium]|nr:transposase domain-containing protein [Clostridia bacterium]